MSLLWGVLLLFIAQYGENARIQASTAAWASGKDYIGLTETEVLRKFGEPTTRQAGGWEYRERLGPGCHSFQLVRVVRFDDGGRVKTAAIEERGVGCILIQPRER